MDEQNKHTAGPEYKPGDPWAICDLSGIKVRFSQTRKTWDGLRVWEPYWYPKHPQLSVRGIADHMDQPDARPRPLDVFGVPEYGSGPLAVVSSNGTVYIVTISLTDTVVATVGSIYENATTALELNGFAFVISNTGTFPIGAATTDQTVKSWLLPRPDGIVRALTSDVHGNLIVQPFSG